MVPLLSLSFHFRVAPGLADAPFPGAAWRGAFGYALKRAVCVMRPRICAGCPLSSACAYPFVFETAPGVETKVMVQADAVPRPFVLRPPGMAVGDGEDRGVQLGMTLIGRAVEYLPYIIRALMDAGRRGVGRERAVHELERVTDGEGRPIWRAGSNLEPRTAAQPAPRLGEPARVAIDLVSPLRLVRDGAPIRPDALDGPTLAFAAVRRVALLRDGLAPSLPPIDLKHFRALARGARIAERNLDWSDKRRFSTRQSQSITMGGITGRLTLDLGGAPELVPFLETCEHVHVGKGATLGLGQITLAPA